MLERPDPADCVRLRNVSYNAVACAGLVALAIAMGIGRFAFTPLLPMMQTSGQLSVAAGGWLASANYLGYLIGALTATRMPVPASSAIRIALIGVGVLTFGMGVMDGFAAWIMLRAAAGVASAWVLIHASGWCLERLAASRRPLLSGMVFGGVGAGIAAAGALCLLLMRFNASSAQAWMILGAVSLASTLAVWSTFSCEAHLVRRAPQRPQGAAPRWNRESVLLVLCYGAFGFGYIVPATFLPAMARETIRDPLVFGWSWPIFGAAAFVSTLLAAVVPRWLHNRRLWVGSQLLMAAGVALPVVWGGIGAIMFAALLVGATFMVTTMVAIKEAKEVAGLQATGLIAAMTAAFAVGQIAGPISASLLAGQNGSFSATLLSGSLVLALSACALAGRPAVRR